MYSDGFFLFLIDFCFWHNLHKIFQGKITLNPCINLESNFSSLCLPFPNQEQYISFDLFGSLFLPPEKTNLPFWSNEIYKSTIHIQTAMQFGRYTSQPLVSNFISLDYTSECNCIIVLHNSMTRSWLSEDLFRHSITYLCICEQNFIPLQESFLYVNNCSSVGHLITFTSPGHLISFSLWWLLCI